MSDPIAAVVQFLRSLPDLPTGSVTGDMNARTVGDTTIYVSHSGGFQVLRDSVDRIDIAFEVYAPDREEAADLAFLVRKHLLRDLRDVTVGSIYFLDADGDQIPDYEPDSSSREHVYCGEVTLFYISD
ncbi:hypothetical protein ACFWNC_14585 [Streptomyces sp. NPDC058369]|uniref:hypothetical protein n=1 Tax=Streptomyces sp. NPDC058369 TaxID=3346462 RepID=UPI00364BB396